MKVSATIIIPNWNGKRLLEKHLPIVIRHTKGADIMVVDDGSNDDSVSFLRSEYPNVQIIQKQRHEGFSSTVNVGVKEARGDIVILLNTDIEPEKGFIPPLLAHFTDERVFAVGCMDKSVENGKTILRGRGIGWWEKGLYVHRKGDIDKTDTDWVSGGSGAFRRSMWNKLKGMDTIFNPFYWEDIDISYRARKAGWILRFESKSKVRHYHEEGNIQKQFSKSYVRQIAFRNQILFIWKHASLAQLILGIIRVPIFVCKRLLVKDYDIVKGYIRAVPFFPQIMLKRF